MSLMMSHFSPFPVDTPALRVQGLGVQEVMRPVFFDRQRGWPNYLFVVFYDHVTCHTRGRRAEVAPGTLVCWRPGTPHGLGNATKAWNHSWLSVNGKDVSAALRETKFPLDTFVPLPDLSFFGSALAELYSEVSRPTTGPDALDVRLARSHVVNLIRRLARALRPTPSRPRVPLALLDLRRYVDAHYDTPIVLTDLADAAGLSVSQLCHLHKHHFGATVMSYVRLVRLQRAAILLRDSDLKVRTVGESVGYANHFHFSKAFRQQFGLSPARFRVAGR